MRFQISPLALSLALHAAAAFVLLSLQWKVTVAVRSSVPQHVTLLAPRVLLPRPKPRTLSPRVEPPPRAPVAQSTQHLVRAFRPALLPSRAPEHLPQPAPFEVVPPPVLLASPDPLPANVPSSFPPRPRAPVKLGNLTAAQVSERVSGPSAIVASGFGSAETNRAERASLPTIASSGFGDARVAKPPLAQASTLSTAATTPVEILSKPRPDYTEEARKLRLEGEVVLEMRFGANGQAEVLRVTHGLGHGLDESAQRAALSIKFRPALKAGTSVDSTAVVHILFQLAY